MKITLNPEVEEILHQYPNPIRQKLLALRQLILDTASETESVRDLEETLKWGEPSYKSKNGSTIRIDRKKSNPDQYALYFICTTSLVGTFRAIYGGTFTYEGNRAIVFNIHEEIPIPELRHCISLALTYHRVKHLPLLGV